MYCANCRATVKLINVCCDVSFCLACIELSFNFKEIRCPSCSQLMGPKLEAIYQQNRYEYQPYRQSFHNHFSYADEGYHPIQYHSYHPPKVYAPMSYTDERYSQSYQLEMERIALEKQLNFYLKKAINEGIFPKGYIRQPDQHQDKAIKFSEGSYVYRPSNGGEQKRFPGNSEDKR